MTEVQKPRKSTQERLELREKRYQMYLELFFNTNLSTPEIRGKLGVSAVNKDWKYCCKRLIAEHGIDNRHRMYKVMKGEWR